MKRGWWFSAAMALLLGAFISNAFADDDSDSGGKSKKKKKGIPPPMKVEEPKKVDPPKEDVKKADPKKIDPSFIPIPGALPPGSVLPEAAGKLPPTIRAIPHPYSRLEGATVLFLVNDAGGNTELSEIMPEAMEGNGCVATKVINWTRTAFETKKDWRDIQAQGRGASRIAMDVAILRKEAPHCRIVIIGHGVGCHVALMAAEMCAPKSIDRIILLGASVSTRYCLDGALAASRGGIDNFSSSLDFTLDRYASQVGTSDGDQSGSTAGMYGFRVQRGARGCENLRQIVYNEKMLGHNGGHNGWVRARFLSEWIVPMISCDAPPAPVFAPPPVILPAPAMPKTK